MMCVACYLQRTEALEISKNKGNLRNENKLNKEREREES